MPVKLTTPAGDLDKKIAEVRAAIKSGEGLTTVEFAEKINRSVSQTFKLCQTMNIARKFYIDGHLKWLVLNPRDLKKYADPS